jgi:lysophospholipase L1-like esterase
LFFGDSNTRGYGVDRSLRHTALLERRLRADGFTSWTFVTVTERSDLRAIPAKIEKAVTTHRPTIIVWRCPTGPATYRIAYPRWTRELKGLHRRWFRWQRGRLVDAELDAGDRKERATHDALTDGTFLNELNRWRLLRVPGARPLKNAMAARYGFQVKATCDRYVERLAEIRDAVQLQVDAPVLMIGLIPHDVPGYDDRVRTWRPVLADRFDRPADGSHYLDVFESLRTENGLLLRDGIHLSAVGHRQLADLVVDPLRELMIATPAAATI